MASISWTVSVANQALALWKLCLSFRKRDWDLADYPIAFRTQEPDPDSDYNSPRFKFHRWIAFIVNWHLSGTGDSPDEAMRSLRSAFEAVKLKRQVEGRPLPRPGTRVPIEFASQERVKAQAELAKDFTHRVLELEWAWISDGSSLWDFHTDETNDAFHAKIKEVYAVDVSDIQSAKVCEILERIAAERNSALG